MRLERLMPKAGVRVQLAAAAAMWLIGATILLVRGFGYVQGRYWHAWILAAGLIVGVVKSRLLLDRIATKAVARIHLRGRASLPGFFSARSWALVALMMGGGIVLRSVVVHPSVIGAGILGAIYIGVGTALLIADRVFWHALFASVLAPMRNGISAPAEDSVPAPLEDGVRPASEHKAS